MPAMKQSFLQQDTGYLKAVCLNWNIPVADMSAEDISDALIETILQPERVSQIILSAPDGVIQAVTLLIRNQGAFPAGGFRERFGDIRIMGDARLEREKPWLAPQSVAEWLWYRGIIQVGMLHRRHQGRGEIAEYVFIPDELFSLLSGNSAFQMSDEKKSELIIRPAAPDEVMKSDPADDMIVDLSCILLAAYRTGNPVADLWTIYGEKKTKFLLKLLELLRIIDPVDVLDPEATQTFLQISRNSAVQQLFSAWMDSAAVDDLRAIEELHVDSLVDYSPKRIRAVIIDLLAKIPEDIWWSVKSFISYVQETEPTFLRPNGENTTWLIQNRNADHFNRWENIEGLYIRYLLACPLNWLDVIDIAYNKKDDPADDRLRFSAFRIRKQGKRILQESPQGETFSGSENGRQSVEQEIPKVNIDGRIILTNGTSRIFRYHTARYCEWEKIEKKQWEFRITPKSLQQAKEKGLSVNAYIWMLRRSAGKAVPEKLLKAMLQWDKVHTQASMYQATLLTVSNPDWIDALINQKNTSRWVEQRINRNTIIIKPKGENIIRRALIELGALVDKQS